MATFTIAGRSVTFLADDVAQRLQGVTPESIQKHAVEVNGRLYPVVQALEVASGVPRSETRSATARRVLAGLGMRLVQLDTSSRPTDPKSNAEINAAIEAAANATSFADQVAAEAWPPLPSAKTGPSSAPRRAPWARMHAQPAQPVPQVDPAEVPTAPGVYAFYRDGEPVYVGRAIAAGGLQRRLKTQHLKTGNDLSWSAFRRNVAEHLGIAPSTVTKQRPPQLTDEQVAPVNEWVAGCELRWISCATEDEASQFEVDLKTERKPPLTKR